MSRTIKDKPSRLLYPAKFGWYYTEETPTKIKRNKSEPWMWLQSTPSWWNRLFHTRPRRRAAHMWERKLTLNNNIRWSDSELDFIYDSFGIPNVTNKPHKYYW